MTIKKRVHLISPLCGQDNQSLQIVYSWLRDSYICSHSLMIFTPELKEVIY